MPIDRETHLGRFAYIYWTAWRGQNYALEHLEQSFIFWDAAQYNEAIYSNIQALSDLRYAVFRLVDLDYPLPALYSMPYFLEHYTGNGNGIDMAAIINAMLEADPLQVRAFVGLMDAYRQSVWNKPFNKEYYAALAKGFM